MGDSVRGDRSVARFATVEERERWDDLLAANPGGGEVWQSQEYLDVKRDQNAYRSYQVIVERPGRASIAVGVLAKPVAALGGEWWHTPAGPAGEDTEAVLDVARAVAVLARAQRAFLLKIEPRLDPSARAALHADGYLDTVRIIPNTSTVLVPVAADSDDALLASLGKKARNAINRARRDGIVVTRVDATDTHCAELYALLRETAQDRFVLRRASYYRAFWQGFARSGRGQMFFAHRDGVLIAGAYAIALGTKTTYKDGASVRAKTAYGASHALQWDVLRWARERGAVVHDLCGAPPSDRVDDTDHPLHGVGQFKRSFQPEITDYAGAFDLPLRPTAYRVWTTVGDRMARRWSLAVRKDPYA